jgi:hypothetical protein
MHRTAFYKSTAAVNSCPASSGKSGGFAAKLAVCYEHNDMRHQIPLHSDRSFSGGMMLRSNMTNPSDRFPTGGFAPLAAGQSQWFFGSE